MEINKNLTENIKEAIARAIVFFDLLGLPLAGSEIWKYLFFENAPPTPDLSLSNVMTVLDEEVAEKRLETKNGFYFLPGRDSLVVLRMKSISLVTEKFETATRATRWLRFVPGVRFVAVCNSLSFGNVHEESDIDFFIITAKDRIWLTRLLVTSVIHLLGIRRYKKRINNKICLSFYLTEDNLDLNPISLDIDPYLYYWIATLVPIYDDNLNSRFIEANSWIKRYLPNYLPVIPHRKRRAGNNLVSDMAKRTCRFWPDSFAGDYLEKTARFIQLKKMSMNTGSLAKENDTRVIISDTILKFHETDKREEYRDRWLKKTDEILK